MIRDVQHHVETCEQCQISKARNGEGHRVPLATVEPEYAWDILAMDVLQVPTSYQGNSYILVVMDYMTKWVEAFPLKEHTAEQVASCLLQVFTRFGVPRRLLSDNGPEFEGRLINALSRQLGIEKLHTTTYHPEGDGMVERMNRTIMQLLRTYIEDEGDWERWLPLVLYAYRTTVQRSTGLTPFEFMFGRDTPSLTLPTLDGSDKLDLRTYSDMKQRLGIYEEYAKDAMSESEAQRAVEYEKKYHKWIQSLRDELKLYQRGSPVLIRDRNHRKLKNPWTKGYSIVMVNPDRYVQVKSDRTGETTWRHLDNVKLLKTRNDVVGVVSFSGGGEMW